MKNRNKSSDRANSSGDFSNNEGFHNYQDRSGYRAGSQGYSPSQNRSEWNRPSLQNSDRYESQQGSDYGTGSQQSERFDARYNGNYGYGANSNPRQDYESSRFGQKDSQQFSNASGNFSWQSPERKSGLHFGKGPKGYRRSDERIREEISEALSAHSEIDASEIEIEVKECIVTLSGTVESRQTKRLVEDTVEAVSGVQDVKNDLRIMASSESSSRSTSSDSDSTSPRSASQGKTSLASRQSSSTESTSGKSIQ